MTMQNTIIITEKYLAARRIAYILSGGTSKRISIKRVPAFGFQRENENVLVIGLSGHIVELDYSEKYNRWEERTIPELIWAKPVRVITNRRLVTAIQSAVRNCNRVIIATDYDREGELIGTEILDIIKSLRPELEVKRAHFSAITKFEIENAFSNLVTVDYNLALSAEARQHIDLAWGAVLTRFISLTAKRLGREFLSVGRVQSPVLALIVDRDREIRNFVPKPYWNLIAHLRKVTEFNATHAHGLFWEREKAVEIYQRIGKYREAVVVELERNEKRDFPPAPFNTTTFLAECASKLKLSTYSAMAIAENLYTNGWISYPRTDNTVYPESLNLRAVLEKLKYSEFRSEVEEILAQAKLRPTRGKTVATDHPPIYPVAAASKKDIVRKEHWNVYELVVRRFLATLAPPGRHVMTKITLKIGEEPFIAEGLRVLEPGWRKYYPYLPVRETSIPELQLNEHVEVLRLNLVEDKTKPPPRYTQASLIQEMERLGLGTKSTRHEIIKKLYERRYVHGSLIPTDSGIALTTTLEDQAEMITKPDMTAELEREMTEIAEGRKKFETVVGASQKMLSEVLRVLHKNRMQISRELNFALKKQEHIGKCKNCDTGMIRIITSAKGKRFAGCTNYPKCTSTFPLPQNGKIIPLNSTCPKCGAPTIKVITKGKKPWILCINMDCDKIFASQKFYKNYSPI